MRHNRYATIYNIIYEESQGQHAFLCWICPCHDAVGAHGSYRGGFWILESFWELLAGSTAILKASAYFIENFGHAWSITRRRFHSRQDDAVEEQSVIVQQYLIHCILSNVNSKLLL
jgi:hypothetical protein